MAYLLRRLVSKQKRRFRDGVYDLDLSYITPRMIACGWPSSGHEGLIRNPFPQLVRMLDTYHKGHYKVFNLCMERSYDAKRFNGPVTHMPAYDHEVPAVEMLQQFVEEADAWLKECEDNVVVVHCKGGKGRTGITLCALLLYQAVCNTPDEAMQLFAEMRTLDMAGVTIGSQQRWIHYYHQVMLQGGRARWQSMPERGSTHLHSLSIIGLPQRLLQGCTIVVSERHDGAIDKVQRIEVQLPATSFGRGCCRMLHGAGQQPKRAAVSMVWNEDRLRVDFGRRSSESGCGRAGEAQQQGCLLQGDLCMQVFTSKARSQRTRLFQSWLDPRFLPERGPVVLPRSHLDKVRPKSLPNAFSLLLDYSHAAGCAPAFPTDHLAAAFRPCKPSTAPAAGRGRPAVQRAEDAAAPRPSSSGTGTGTGTGSAASRPKASWLKFAWQPRSASSSRAAGAEPRPQGSRAGGCWPRGWGSLDEEEQDAGSPRPSQPSRGQEAPPEAAQRQPGAHPVMAAATGSAFSSPPAPPPAAVPCSGARGSRWPGLPLLAERGDSASAASLESGHSAGRKHGAPCLPLRLWPQELQPLPELPLERACSADARCIGRPPPPPPAAAPRPHRFSSSAFSPRLLQAGRRSSGGGAQPGAGEQEWKRLDKAWQLAWFAGVEPPAKMDPHLTPPRRSISLTDPQRA